MVGFTDVEAGLGEEAVEEAGPVLSQARTTGPCRPDGGQSRPGPASVTPDEAPGPASMIRCARCRHLAAFPAGKCSKPADTPPPRSRRRLRPCEVTRHRTSAASWGVAGRAGRRADPGTISAQTDQRW